MSVIEKVPLHSAKRGPRRKLVVTGCPGKGWWR